MFMGKEIVPVSTNPGPALFEQLGISRVKKSDQFTISYRDGFLEANVKRKSGKTETAVKHVRGDGFTQLTTFDPEGMDKNERNDLIKNKYAKGHTQSDLAKLFGLSQAMISRIVGS
jgi:hypothetical protein